MILETFKPGYLPSLGLGYDDLKETNPGLIMCSLTPFGQSGPWSGFVTSDLIQLSAGGQMGCCGYNEEDVEDPPPIAGGGGQSWHMGSHYAYIAMMAALNQRAVTGRGQYIDSAVHDACALTTEMHVLTYIYTGEGGSAQHWPARLVSHRILPAQEPAADQRRKVHECVAAAAAPHACAG